MQFLNGIKIKPRFIVSIVKQYEPRIIIITTNYEQYTVPTKILLGKNSIYHEEQVLYQSPVHLPRPIGSLKGHGLRQKIQHLFTYILGSSECQSFCRVSSNIHSSEKLGKMYILEALTKYAMFPQKLKSSLFVCLFLNRLKFSLHYFNYIFLRHVYRFPNPQQMALLAQLATLGDICHIKVHRKNKCWQKQTKSKLSHIKVHPHRKYKCWQKQTKSKLSSYLTQLLGKS